MKKLALILLVIIAVTGTYFIMPESESGKESPAVEAASKLMRDSFKDWEVDDVDGAIEKTNKIISLFEGEDHPIKAIAYVILGETYISQNNYIKAEGFLIKAEILAEKHFLKRDSRLDERTIAISYIRTLLGLGKVYLSTNRVDEGLAKIQESLTIAQSKEYSLGTIRAALVLATAYQQLCEQKKMKKALLLLEGELLLSAGDELPLEYSEEKQIEEILSSQALVGCCTGEGNCD